MIRCRSIPSFAFAASFALFVAACDGERTAAPRDPTQQAALVVTTAPIVRERVPESVSLTGTLFGADEVALASEVSGRIERVAHDLGDRVEAGALLARIDPLDFELARDERARALAQRLAALGLDDLPGDDFDPETLPRVVRARLEMENAERRFERSRGLADARTSAISEQALADLRTAAEVAASELALARLEAAASLAEARTLEAQLRLAVRRLEQSEVRAPGESGRVWAVAERRVAAGDRAREGDVLFRLVATDPLLLRGPLPQRHFGRVRIGQAVEVTIDAIGGSTGGVVARVAPSIDVATRSFTIEARVENPAGRLAPGAFATARIVVGEREGLFAPADVVTSFAGVQRVFAVEGGVARERRVEPVPAGEGRVELRGALQEGEMLILDPPARLVDGAPVDVRDLPTRP